MALSRPDSVRRGALEKALVWSGAWCLAAGGLAALAGVFLPEPAKERVLKLVLFPLPLITAGLAVLIDFLGPTGRAEPASSYLSAGTVHALTVLAFVVYAALIFLLAFSLIFWKRHRPSPEPIGKTNKATLH